MLQLKIVKINVNLAFPSYMSKGISCTSSTEPGERNHCLEMLLSPFAVEEFGLLV